MPTPDFIEGFTHQNTLTGTLQGTLALISSITGSVSYPAGRNGVGVQIIEASGAAHNISYTMPVTTTRVLSLYFKIPSAPSVQSELLNIRRTTTFSVDVRFEITTGGAIAATAGTTVTGPTVADNAWHLLDLYFNGSANPHILKWAVDQVAQTDCSDAAAAVSEEHLLLGTLQTVDTLTVLFDDVVGSVTGADYPLGPHNVFGLVPNGDGTHAAGVNVIENQAGTDITSPNAFPLIDEVPASESDYIRQFAIGASNYAEVTFADTGESTVWGVRGFAAGRGEAAGTSTFITRVVDSGGTTLTDISTGTTTVVHRVGWKIVADPGGGGWTPAELNGLKARIGLASNVSGVPFCSGLLLEYASPIAAGGGATVADPFGMSGFFGV